MVAVSVTSFLHGTCLVEQVEKLKVLVVWTWQLQWQNRKRETFSPSTLLTQYAVDLLAAVVYLYERNLPLAHGA